MHLAALVAGVVSARESMQQVHRYEATDCSTSNMQSISETWQDDMISSRASSSHVVMLGFAATFDM